MPDIHVFRAKGTTVRNHLAVTGGESDIEVSENTDSPPTCNNIIGLANRFSSHFCSWHISKEPSGEPLVEGYHAPLPTSAI